ncbi:amidohydrolase family protein [Pigmentiphaga soli]|uniref:Amidohydrolase family protein n=1 Tax=Pigmentiphaga soli TaxID=1007095 RepID=A0ABP8GQ48_9BURK
MSSDVNTMPTTGHGRPLPVDAAWLALGAEQAIDPGVPIVDAHHHLWQRPGWRYLLDEITADLDSGHNVVATVFIQCRSMYRTEGPEALRAVGETEFAAGCARASGGRVCAGIVSHADLLMGEAVQEVLDAHAEAGAGRLRGVRHSTAWDADPEVVNPELGTRPGVMQDARFLAGFARLAPLGLSYDAWVYHPQMGEVAALARRFPDTRIVLNHIGGPIGIGHYAGERERTFADWRRNIAALAACDNVVVKFGGLGMRLGGAGYHLRPAPPSSAALAQDWRPWFDATLDAFGAQRCMFESNFPVDKASCGYATLWNAFKRLAGQASAAERAALFAGTAIDTYRLELPL